MRISCLVFAALLIVASCWAGESIAPAPVGGYRFTAGQGLIYDYTVKQDVAWESAGDRLSYVTTMNWRFAVQPEAITPERVELVVTVLRVQATHTGPGSDRRVDGALPAGNDGRDDPLLGHLLEMKNAVLTVVLDPRSGVVSEVRGGDELVKRLAKRFPPAFPGDPPPLEAAAKAAYGNEALVRQWNQLLALPGSGTQTVPLGPPLEAALERTWTGSAYTLALPAAKPRLDVQLLKDPTPVSGVLADLAGEGRVDLQDGAPKRATGTLRFTLTLSALTQPVVQRHQLTWTLARLAR